jgi:hypothetical protein
MKRQVTLSRQVIKYLSVGCVANGLAYALYLLMTLLGINPVWSMTAVYLAASSTSFAANKVWTFKSDTDLGVSLGKYVIVQLLGYVTNLVVLTALHYGLGVPHSLAQLIGIAFVAIELFTLTRNYVFV